MRGLTIRGSGTDLEEMDSGVFVEKTAAGAVVEGNRIEGQSLRRLPARRRERRRAEQRDHRHRGGPPERGRQRRLGLERARAPRCSTTTSASGATASSSITSKRNVFSGNRFRDLRFAVHYMYTNDSEITDNVSIGNAVGFAIMYSQPTEDHAATSRTATATTASCSTTPTAPQIIGNMVLGRLQPAERWTTAGTRGKDGKEHGLPRTRRASPSHRAAARIGPEKCVFIYNANQNRFRDNWFEGCEIGIHFTAGSEGNEIVGNAFIRNRNQVKYVGTRYLDWSKDGRGNYWSDNPAFDLNGDGLGDSAYRPNDLDRQGAVDRAAGQGADQQPRRAGDPLGAGAVSGPAARAAWSTAIR